MVDMQKAMEAVRDVIAEEGDPKKMSKAEFKEFLEEIDTDITGQLEAVTEELENDE